MPNYLAFKIDLINKGPKKPSKNLTKSLIKLASKLFICVNALLEGAELNATVCIVIVGHICKQLLESERIATG